MNQQRFRIIPFILGAAALVSFHAHAAAPADGGDPWPRETPAKVYFGDTDSSAGPGRPDVPATVSFVDSLDQDGPVVMANSSIVDTQFAQGEPAERGAITLAHSDGVAAGMH